MLLPLHQHRIQLKQQIQRLIAHCKMLQRAYLHGQMLKMGQVAFAPDQGVVLMHPEPAPLWAVPATVVVKIHWGSLLLWAASGLTADKMPKVWPPQVFAVVQIAPSGQLGLGLVRFAWETDAPATKMSAASARTAQEKEVGTANLT